MSTYYTTWKNKHWMISTSLGNLGVMEIPMLPPGRINFFKIGSGAAGKELEQEFIEHATKVLNGEVDLEIISLIL